jgi:hypothetical protein
LVKSSQRNPRGKKHCRINVYSAKGNALKNRVVSWIGPRRKHKVKYSWVDFRKFKGINFYMKL